MEHKDIHRKIDNISYEVKKHLTFMFECSIESYTVRVFCYKLILAPANMKFTTMYEIEKECEEYLEKRYGGKEVSEKGRRARIIDIYRRGSYSYELPEPLTNTKPKEAGPIIIKKKTKDIFDITPAYDLIKKEKKVFKLPKKSRTKDTKYKYDNSIQNGYFYKLKREGKITDVESYIKYVEEKNNERLNRKKEKLTEKTKKEIGLFDNQELIFKSYNQKGIIDYLNKIGHATNKGSVSQYLKSGKMLYKKFYIRFI